MVLSASVVIRPNRIYSTYGFFIFSKHRSIILINLHRKKINMKKFLKTYFSNDGAGVFAFLWVIAIIVVVYLLIAQGGNKY